MTTSGGEHAERFTHLRPLLFTIAYEILGSATESDDVLQDSYLRHLESVLREVWPAHGIPIRFSVRGKEKHADREKGKKGNLPRRTPRARRMGKSRSQAH